MHRPLARVLFVTAILLSVLGSAAFVSAQELRFFRIGTGTTGGTYFPIGGLIANAISNPPGSRPCERGGSCGVPGLIAVAQATSGAVENVAQMQAGALESALVQSDIAYWSHTGTGIYEGQPQFDGLRAIASLYPETLHLVVRADGDIHSVSDLRGKTVALGDEGSGTLVDARVVLEAYGLSEQDITPRYLKPGPASDRLVSGDVDAFFIVGGFPIAAVSDAAARIAIRLVPFDDPISEELSQTLPFFTRTQLPEGVYDGVAATPVLAVGALWVVRADVPEDLVYGITRALWNPKTTALLAAGHPRGKSIQLTDALRGIAVPLHPGAERYYREIGLPAEAKVETPTVEAVPPSDL